MCTVADSSTASRSAAEISTFPSPAPSNFECMFDSVVALTAGTSGAGAVEAWSRVESAACARKVAAMAGMLETAYAASGSASRDLWCLDNWDAVAAQYRARLDALGARPPKLAASDRLQDR